MSNAIRNLTLEDLLEKWLQNLRESDYSPKTILRYRKAISGFLSWYVETEHRSLEFEDLTPIALVAYRNSLQKKNEVATVNTNLAALRAWCLWLSSNDYLEENPASRLKLIKRQVLTSPKALPPNAINALFREAGRSGRYPKRNLALVMLLLQTGLRIGECAALNLEDIEFGEKAGKLLVRSGKGNKSRIIPLNGSARQALADYLAPIFGIEPTLRAVSTRWPTSSANETPLWRSERGKGRMTVSAMERVITNLMDKCASRKLVSRDATAHSLRHTFATRYLATHPGDLVGLAHLLGHESLDTTRIYLQPNEEEVARRLEDLDLNAFL